ncbi:MAG TPA: GNAT family N-acetyltransferase, partial [Candidatus Limnocylindrales bacterium]
MAYRPPDFRLAQDDDIPACAAVWETAIADYERRLGRPTFATDLGPIVRLLRHLRSTDPERFWVATRPWNDAIEAAVQAGRPMPPRNGGSGTGSDAIVGFGSAVVRGRTWFLSMLFVLPEEQARGIGRAIMARTFPGGRLPEPGERSVVSDMSPPAILGTATDSAQPISNA